MPSFKRKTIKTIFFFGSFHIVQLLHALNSSIFTQLYNILKVPVFGSRRLELVLHTFIATATLPLSGEGGFGESFLLVGLVSPGGLGLVSPQRIFVDAAPKGRVEPGLKSLETKESTCAPKEDGDEGEEYCSSYVGMSVACWGFLCHGPLVSHHREGHKVEERPQP